MFQLSTVTDRLQAIGGRLEVLNEYESTSWAGELQGGVLDKRRRRP